MPSRRVSWYNFLPLFSVFCCSICPLRCLSGILIVDSSYIFSYCLLLLCLCRKVKPNTLFYLHFFGILSHYLDRHTYLQDTELRIIPSMMDARRKLEETYIDSSIQSLSSTSFQRYCSQLRTSHHFP
jgi:hypothetical protein